MRVELTISQREVDGMAGYLDEALAATRPAVLGAMGERFEQIVHGNFGIAGVDRPNAWAPLSPAYAKKVGREIATLRLTGALEAAIKRGGSEGESVTVSVSDSDVPYATVHQTGGVRMPKRPYFPIGDDGQVLDWTERQVVEAAADALGRELS